MGVPVKMRDESVFVRVSVAERKLVDRAATLSDVGPGVFGRKAILAAARRVVGQHEAQREREAARTRGGVAASIVRDVFAALPLKEA